MVSNEDREAAIAMLRETPCVFDGAIDPLNADIPTPEEAQLIVNALVSHGWGPKPAVEAQRLNDLVTACTMGITLNPLTDYLEQAGIEVTYD